MKQQIPASAVADIKGFAATAAAHAAEMRSWRAHMVRVNEDAANHVPIQRRHLAYPRPRAHPLVERAVDEKDEVNFEIADDGPTPAEKLEVRKTELMNEVLLSEAKAIAAVVPGGKQRLFNLRESAIRAADQAKAEALVTSSMGLLKKITGAAISPEQIAARIEAERPAEDTAHLRAHRRNPARRSACPSRHRRPDGRNDRQLETPYLLRNPT